MWTLIALPPKGVKLNELEFVRGFTRPNSPVSIRLAISPLNQPLMGLSGLYRMG
jgi:hypothetical protein